MAQFPSEVVEMQPQGLSVDSDDVIEEKRGHSGGSLRRFLWGSSGRMAGCLQEENRAGIGNHRRPQAVKH